MNHPRKPVGAPAITTLATWALAVFRGGGAVDDQPDQTMAQ
ncbi:hypothetical protein [Pseudomonas abieticivorans]|nr:hypothetical protein [Pseudomonas sp. PIA16]